MSSNKMQFNELYEGNFGFVTLANDISCKTVGNESISLKFENGYYYHIYFFYFKEVRYIPELARNLLSIAPLDVFYGKFENSMLKITGGSLVSFKVIKKNGIYVTKSIKA